MSTSEAKNQNNNEHSSMDFISQMVASGLSSTFDSLKEKVATNIKDNGEQYLTDALEKLKTSATDLAEWSKKNPVKTTIAVAAILAVTAFLVNTVKSSSAGSESGEENAKTPAKSSKNSAKAKTSAK